MRTRVPVWVALFCVAGVYLSADVGRHALDDVDGLYTDAAREMLRRGDLVTPYADGVRFLDKPPLTFWAMAGSYKLFGLREYAGRLPFALAVLATAWLLWRAGERAGEGEGGALGAACFGLCTGTFLFTRTVQPDTLLVAFETLAFLSFLEWHWTERAPALFSFWGALGGAVLAKGLLGLVLPFGMVGLFLASRGELRRLAGLLPRRALLLFSALTLPWFVLAAMRNNGFLWHFFIDEHLLRFFGKREPLDYHSLPVGVFWGLLLVWLLPFTVFLPAVGALLRRRAALGSRARDLVELCAAWATVGLVLFTLSTRLEHYALAFLPPLALLVGLALSRFKDAEDSLVSLWVERGVLFLAGGGIVLGLALLQAAGLWGQALVAAPGRSVSAETYDFAPLFHLPVSVAPALGLLARLAALVSILGGASLLALAGAAKRRASLLMVLAMAAAFCGLSARALNVCDPALSTEEFGTALNRIHEPGDTVVSLGDFETANSLSVYTTTPLLVLEGRAAVLEWGLRFPDAPLRILSRGAFTTLWEGPSRTFLLAPSDLISGLALPHYAEVLRSGGRVLLCNHALGKQ